MDFNVTEMGVKGGEKPRPLGRGRFKYWKKRLFRMSSPGQFLGNEERGPIPPQYREKASKKLKQ